MKLGAEYWLLDHYFSSYVWKDLKVDDNAQIRETDRQYEHPDLW
jgi:hypothetical protein